MVWALGLAALVVLALIVRVVITTQHESLLARLRPRDTTGIVRGGDSITLDASPTLAVLVLHGFGDTPQSVAPVARVLHARGFTVRAPLLAGHGRTMQEMATHTHRDWLDSARTAYDTLRASHDHVAIVGQSMGGALAVQLAVEHPPPALVLLAPYLSMPRSIRRVAGLLRWIAPVVPYWRSRTPSRSIHDPLALSRALAHPSTSARALSELERVSDVAFRRLPMLTTPTLVLQSREDNRIPPDAAERAFAVIGASQRELRWFTGRGHVLAVDHDHETIAMMTADWIEEVGQMRPRQVGSLTGAAPTHHQPRS
jgi:carboxylesterase